MSAFDIDAYIESMERPAVVVDGKGYIGRILSLHEWLPFEQRFRTVGESADPMASLTLITEYLYKVFPKSKRPWHKDIVQVIVDSPALMEVVTHFLELQATALTPKNLNNLMNGTSPVVNPSPDSQ